MDVDSDSRKGCLQVLFHFALTMIVLAVSLTIVYLLSKAGIIHSGGSK